MSKKTIVHVVGTRTIGEPLIGLFNEHREAWGMGHRVSFISQEDETLEALRIYILREI